MIDTAGQTPRRSDGTRARILAAAREQFAGEGYERTTIRSVASAARIDPSMVMRYYGSKEGLFAAAAATVQLSFPDMDAVPRDKLGEAIVTHFLHRWEGEGGETLQVILRTAASNRDAAERLRTIHAEQVTALVTHLRGGRDSAREAALIGSQIMGLAYCRYILHMPSLLDIPREDLIRTVGATIQRYLE